MKRLICWLLGHDPYNIGPLHWQAGPMPKGAPTKVCCRCDAVLERAR